MNMAKKIYGGLEGGASYSKLVLLDDAGNLLGCVNGPSTNHLLVGLDECQKRIFQMVEEAKKKIGIDSNTNLCTMGLCMSGCEQEESNQNLKKLFQEKYSDVSQSYTVASDTVGSILTACPNGGLVLIAGTGSNALLLNPDGTTARCGGWGHLLGDEASGMWISLKAVKAVFDTEDNLVKAPHSVHRIKELMLEHFKVTDKFGVLEHCYVNFNKSFFAGLCEKLAKAALEGDAMCKYIFFEAGRALGAHVLAVLPNAHKGLIESEGGLHIVCVGSIFKSWTLLQEGFHSVVKYKLSEFTLLELTTTAAIGAAYFGAKETGVKIPMKFEKNYSILYHFKA